MEIVAARSKDSGGEAGEAYTSMSGTSMATPHVAGAAALLAEKHSGWKAGELKAALVGSAKRNPKLGAYAQGAGRVDVARAIGHDGYATPAAISAGRAAWPHDDDKPVTETVTYHNPGDKPVTYQLEVATLGPDGEAAAEGMFTTSAKEVTVPADGTATVDVTVDTTVKGPDGYYSGWVTATAGNAEVITPVAVDKEVESYDLTVNVKGSDSSVPEHLVILEGIDAEVVWFVADPEDGSETLRLPAGRYHVVSYVDEESNTSLLTQPEYGLTKDSTLVIDAGRAKPVSVTLDEPKAEFGIGSAGYSYRSDIGGFGANVVTDDLTRVRTAHLGPEVAKDKMLTEVSGHWGTPDADGETPKDYFLSYYEYGRLVTGYKKKVRERDLAAVKATYHADTKGRLGMKMWLASAPGWDVSGTGTGFPLPQTRMEYHNVDGVIWEPMLFLETKDESVGELVGGVPNHEAGKTYRETWNAAAYGPRLSSAGAGVTRNGDKLKVAIPVYSDSAGHQGFSETASESTVLYRNGKKVGDAEQLGYGEFTVPAGEANYRLTADATRKVSNFATKVSCEWTFRSAHTGRRTVLPVATVGFAPKVNSHNRAKAGGTQEVPVTLSTAKGSPAVKLTRLTVEVSYDDGETWKKLPVVATPHGSWTARVSHPKDASFVSLRTHAVDKKGNSVKQTIIRAYGLK